MPMSKRILYHRPHEYGGENRVRVWDDSQARYGQFDVITRKEFQDLQARDDVTLVDREDDED